MSGAQTSVAFHVGGKYNWRHQPERLVYLGKNWSGNGYWHQFAKIEAPRVVWCEVLDDQLSSFEESTPATELSTASAGEAFTHGMPDTSALVNLLARWEARSRDALPVDAMLVNKHIRELREALAASPAPGRAPLTETQAQALRSATPGGDWFDEEQAAIFERGIRAAERYHGIAPAGGIGGDKTPLDDPVN